MVKRVGNYLILLLLLINNAYAKTDHCIVYIHIGDTIPAYAHDAIKQAALFNPDTPIYMLANQKGLDSFNDSQAIGIPIESLKQSRSHATFLKKTPWKGGLYFYSLERFFYLDEFVNQYDLKHIFHMEYDNMLYVTLHDLLPIFKKYYPTAAVPLDNDKRAIAGIIYFSGSNPLSDTIDFFIDHPKKRLNDMQLLGLYSKKSKKKGLDNLPIIHSSYAIDHRLITPDGHKAKTPSEYYRHVDDFNGIFDAAALGQYLGGIDTIHFDGGIPGFINESCVFNPSKLEYVWEKDRQGRKIPYAIYKNEKRRIINLHVHCKKLTLFSSIGDES